MAELVEIRVVTRGAGRAKKDLEGIGSSARRAGTAVTFLRGTLVGLATAGAARELLQLADASTRINNRLNLLTNNQQITNALFNDLADVAARTRSAIEPTVDLFSRLQRSTQDLGLTTNELLGLTTSVNQAFQIYGNTAAEAEAATIQFAQGLAAGALRGDELRSVLEQAPRLAQALVDGINETGALGEGIRVTIGDLRELGRQGVLTADIITEALATQADVLDSEFRRTLPTIEQSFINLRNQALIAFRELNEGGKITGSVAQAINDLAGAIRPTVAFLAEFAGIFIEVIDILGGAVGVIGETNAQVVGLTAAIAALSAVLRVNPLILLATSAIAALAAIRQLRDSKTELTIAVEQTVASIGVERAQVEALSDVLDEGTIKTEETAQAKLKEALARQENIRVLREEGQARLEAARAEIQALLATAREVQESNFDIGGVILNPFANIQLIQLEGQVKNAFSAFKALSIELERFDELTESNQENIRRLQELIASGTLESIEEARARRELAAEQERALQSLTRSARGTGETAAKAIRDFNRELSRIEITAGTGADALEELARLQDDLVGQRDNVQDLIERYRLGGVAESELQPLLRALEDIGEAERALETVRLEAQNQAIQDVIASIRQERDELALTSDELAIRNRLREIGLTIDAVSPEILSQLREEQRLLAETNMLKEQQIDLEERRADILAGLGSRNVIAELAEEAAVLQSVLDEPDMFGIDQINAAEQGLAAIADRLREIQIEAEQGDIFNDLILRLENFALTGAEAMEIFGQSLGDVSEQLTGRFADAVADAIVNGGDLGETLKSIARDAIAELISSLIQLAIRFAINQALSLALGNAVVAQNAAQAATLASLYATPAALASLASFGGNAAPASAALIGTTALSRGLAAIPGFADGGFVQGAGGPRDDRVIAALSNGEFVVNAAATRENRALLEAINSGFASSGGNSFARNVQVDMNVVTQDADSFSRSRRQISRELQTGLDRIG